MKYYQFILVGVFLGFGLLGCSEKKETKDDFQVVCEYFQELEKLENIDEMTFEDRNDFILTRIEKNISGSAVNVSWEAVSYAAPEQRYEIFKMGAESELNKVWDCSSMERLAPLTGAVE